MLSDIRVGLRLLWKDKAFTSTAALTLALCIGANTALFSVVHNVLLRPLPFAESDRIVLMENLYPAAGADTGSAGVPDYYDRLRDVTAYEEQALYNTNSLSIDQDGTPARITVTNATPSFFRVLKGQPLLGRTFTDSEGEVGNDKKVVLSYSLWQSQFGGDPTVIGRDLRLDGQPYTIVGVMPRTFFYLNPDVLAWRALAFTADERSDGRRHSNNWNNIARLRPGASLEQAQAQIDALNRANLDRFPQYRELLVAAGFRTRVSRLQDTVVRDVRSTLYLLWGGALFVLLIGCVNVANLVLVRSRARLKELATRLAIGAGRGRVARQLVTESVMLTLVSAIGGLVVGYGALRLLGTLNIQEFPRGSEIRLDGIVAAYTMVAAAMIGIVLGLIQVCVLPASLTSVLREEGRGTSSGRGARTLRRALVVAQVAVAFVLLVGAGLLFASFRRVLTIDPGFRPAGVLTASVSLPRTRYADDKAIAQFTRMAIERIRALPGVASAGAGDMVPLNGNHNDSVILAEGYRMKPGESVISPNQVQVSPGYFDTLGVRLARGRFFTDHDSADAPKTVIVDEKLARHFWPNQDPIGRRMYLPTDLDHIVAITDKTVFRTVVGVVHDVRLGSIVENPHEVGSYYFPLDQEPSRGIVFAARTAGDPHALAGAVRETINQLDRELPVFDTKTMDEFVERSLVSRRSPVLLSLSFGAVALFLSAIGIYGVLAYLVTQRTKEIGIRMALGSSAGAVFELVLREGLLLIGSGFVLGAAGALALRRTLETQLFGITATDPLVLSLVSGILAVVAVVACALPARRATRIDPIVALSN